MSRKPYFVGRRPTKVGRPVFDRATGEKIGFVTQHHNDDLWYFHELYDGSEVEEASGRERTMDDAAAELHWAWIHEQTRQQETG